MLKVLKQDPGGGGAAGRGRGRGGVGGGGRVLPVNQSVASHHSIRSTKTIATTSTKIIISQAER